MKQPPIEVRATPLSARVAHDVLRRILAGEFASEGMLPSERLLQATYNVSRPVVREAIKILSARGIATPVNGVGVVINQNVRASTLESLLLAFHQQSVTLADMLAVRLVIEPHVVGLATTHATPVQIDAMYANCVMMRQLASHCDATDIAQRYNSANVEFHVLIAEASHNPVFIILTDVLMGGIWQAEHHANRFFDPTAYTGTADAHQHIVDAIVARDGATAHAAMVEHIQQTRAHLEQAQLLTQIVRFG